MENILITNVSIKNLNEYIIPILRCHKSAQSFFVLTTNDVKIFDIFKKMNIPYEKIEILEKDFIKLKEDLKKQFDLEYIPDVPTGNKNILSKMSYEEFLKLIKEQNILFSPYFLQKLYNLLKPYEYLQNIQRLSEIDYYISLILKTKQMNLIKHVYYSIYRLIQNIIV